MCGGNSMLQAARFSEGSFFQGELSSANQSPKLFLPWAPQRKLHLRPAFTAQFALLQAEPRISPCCSAVSFHSENLSALLNLFLLSSFLAEDNETVTTRCDHMDANACSSLLPTALGL